MKLNTSCGSRVEDLNSPFEYKIVLNGQLTHPNLNYNTILLMFRETEHRSREEEVVSRFPESISIGTFVKPSRYKICYF